MAARIIDIDWIIENEITFFLKFGMNAENIRSHFEYWNETNPKRKTNDYLWYLFQNILKQINQQVSAKLTRYELFADTYWEMWQFEKTEEKKGNANLRLAFENRLKAWELSYNFKTEIVILSGNCCEFCDS